MNIILITLNNDSINLKYIIYVYLQNAFNTEYNISQIPLEKNHKKEPQTKFIIWID